MRDTVTARSGGERLKRMGMYSAVLLVAFLLGLLPMWMQARARASERDAAQQTLRLTQLETTLAAAAIQARRGEYEPAREAASTFYTSLTAEMDRMPSVFTTPQRERLQALLAERDQMITLLARADPAVAERLTDAYVSFRQAMGTLPPAIGGVQ
jgi:Tfp pilus assembly protein PilV